MKNVAFVASVLLSSVVSCLSVTPAFSQLGGEGYSYSGGSARVVNQASKAYHMPGATAIGSGTMSRSAQGFASATEQSNPGLPTVHWGSTVSTCGDQQYKSGFRTGHRTVDPSMIPNVSNTAIINDRLPGVNWGGTIGTCGDGIRSDFHPDINKYNNAWWHAKPGIVQKRLPAYLNQQNTATYGGGAVVPASNSGATYGTTLSY
jgi:hypothetical protein